MAAQPSVSDIVPRYALHGNRNFASVLKSIAAPVAVAFVNFQ
jgi:hypothetical protein